VKRVAYQHLHDFLHCTLLGGHLDKYLEGQAWFITKLF